MTSWLAGSLLLLAAAAPPGRDHAQALSGKRLLIKGASCAGLAFTDEDSVAFYAEMDCSHGQEPTVEARLRWLGRDVFVATQTGRIDKDCPPRSWVYQVESLTAKSARLREVCTGWGTTPTIASDPCGGAARQPAISSRCRSAPRASSR